MFTPSQDEDPSALSPRFLDLKRFLIPAATALLALAALLTWANRPYPAFPEGVQVDRIVVHKADSRMVLLGTGRFLVTPGAGSTPSRMGGAGQRLRLPMVESRHEQC